MTDIALLLAVVFAAGLVMVLLRLPALLGFLLAGFVLNAAGVQQLPYLQFIADLGVTLLLFGIGLKLDLRSLLSREVWVTTVGHLVGSVLAGTAFLWVVGLLGYPMLRGIDLGTLALIGFALSFSSTVFVIKVLEEHSELQSFYGRVAIGILVMQDLAAVIFMTATSEHLPNIMAIPLVLGMFPLRWAARQIWDRLPSGEMQALFGLAMALGPGYALFDAVGLKGDLGALIVGMLLAGHKAAGELSHSLFLVKDLLLVGFFVSIGYIGLPTAQAAGMGLIIVLLLPVQIALYIWLLYAHRLRRRTSVKAGLLLGNYSEFGLIVTSVAVTGGLLDEEWLVVMSVAVALGFVVATLINEKSDEILAVARRILPMHSPEDVHVHEKPISFGSAQAIVMGMGRIGRAAYRDLEEVYGLEVLGVENLPARVEDLQAAGMDIVEADAADRDFWSRLEPTGAVEIVVLAMPFHGANRRALDQLSTLDYPGVVAAVASSDTEVKELRTRGADVVIHLYEGAGADIAEKAADAVADRA